MNIRPAAVAGSWYPGSASTLTRAVEGHLADARSQPPAAAGDVIALVAPHAGLAYSGPVAAHAYRLLDQVTVDVVIVVGPSHFVGFEGVAAYPTGAFETPLGLAFIEDGCVAALLRATPVVRENTSPHLREHSIEMQLPFVQHLAPSAKIVPLLMGWQTAATAKALGDALAQVVSDRRALLVASTDLSHYRDATTTARLDGIVLDHVSRLDADGLQHALDIQPDLACGGGPTVAVMRAARALGAREATVLKYGDSGDITGDKSAVVGYMAAAIGVRGVRL
jgi:MEMO1 family protein